MRPADATLQGEVHLDGDLAYIPEVEVATARYEPICKGARDFLFKIIGDSRVDDLLQADAVEIGQIIVGEVEIYRRGQEQILALPPEKTAMSRRLEKMTRLAINDFTAEQIADEVEPKADPDLVDDIVAGFTNIVSRTLATGGMASVSEYIKGIDWDDLAARKAEFVLTSESNTTNGHISSAGLTETPETDLFTSNVDNSSEEEAEETERPDPEAALLEQPEPEAEPIDLLVEPVDANSLESAVGAEGELAEADPELLPDADVEGDVGLLDSQDIDELEQDAVGGLGDGIGFEGAGRPPKKGARKSGKKVADKIADKDAEKARAANARRDSIVAELEKEQTISKTYDVLGGRTFDLTARQHRLLGLLIHAAGDTEINRKLTVDELYWKAHPEDAKKTPKVVHMDQHIRVAYPLWWMVRDLDKQFGDGEIIKSMTRNTYYDFYLQYSINPKVINTDLLADTSSRGSGIRPVKSAGHVRQGAIAGSRM